MIVRVYARRGIALHCHFCWRAYLRMVLSKIGHQESGIMHRSLLHRIQVHVYGETSRLVRRMKRTTPPCHFSGTMTSHAKKCSEKFPVTVYVSQIAFLPTFFQTQLQYLQLLHDSITPPGLPHSSKNHTQTQQNHPHDDRTNTPHNQRSLLPPPSSPNPNTPPLTLLPTQTAGSAKSPACGPAKL